MVTGAYLLLLGSPVSAIEVPLKGGGKIDIKGDDSEFKERVIQKKFEEKHRDGTTESKTYTETVQDLFISHTHWIGSTTWELAVPGELLAFKGALQGTGTYTTLAPFGDGTPQTTNITLPSFTAMVDVSSGNIVGLNFDPWFGDPYDLDANTSTGRWSAALDSTEPILGNLNLQTGAFSLEFTYLFSSENVTLEGGAPIPFVESLSGTITPTPVPEPSTTAFVGFLILLAGTRLYKKFNRKISAC